MTQFAVVNSSKRLADADVVFLVAAVNDQAMECADAWGVPRSPVAFYAGAVGLPIGECQIIDIVDDLDEPGALGYHTDVAGVVYGRVLAQDFDGTACTLSHEVLETLVDPGCNSWRPRADGLLVALEVSDPVEADAYPITLKVMGEPRTVLLSNYVRPEWFDPNDLDPDSQRDRMGRLREPFAMSAGGYMVVADAAGNQSEVFARRPRVRATARGELAAGRKLARPDSRLIRRLRAR